MGRQICRRSSSYYKGIYVKLPQIHILISKIHLRSTTLNFFQKGPQKYIIFNLVQ